MEREFTGLEQRLYKFLDDMDSITEYDVTRDRWGQIQDKVKQCKEDCKTLFGVICNGYSAHIKLPFDADVYIANNAANKRQIEPCENSLGRHEALYRHLEEKRPSGPANFGQLARWLQDAEGVALNTTDNVIYTSLAVNRANLDFGVGANWKVRRRGDTGWHSVTKRYLGFMKGGNDGERE